MLLTTGSITDVAQSDTKTQYNNYTLAIKYKCMYDWCVRSILFNLL